MKHRKINFGTDDLEHYADWLACNPTLAMDSAEFVWVRAVPFGEIVTGWDMRTGSVEVID